MFKKLFFIGLVISIFALSMSHAAQIIHKLLEVKPDQCPYCGAWIEED